MARIIAIANQKGGVGKTTTAISLSSSLAHFNRRVLLLDMDPQGNSSRGVGTDVSVLSRSVYDVLVKSYDINRIIKKTPMKNLELIPANLKLASTEAEVSRVGSEPYFLLKRALDELKKEYDYIIVDCPPSLGLLSLNALVASQSVLIPVQCEYFAMEAVAQILATITRVQTNYNPNLIIEGFLLTMYDSRTRLGTEISTQVRGLFKENTFLTQIPRNISLPEASARGIPITLYRPTSSGSLAYMSLAKEVIDHEPQ
ncbi:MAG: AAA family ATPase [Bacilli bacterium]|jgi:chromosome partitioning protein